MSQEDEREEAVLSRFKPIELSCRRTGIISDFWVFWSKEEGPSLVSAALCSFEPFLVSDVLVQFWAPTTTTMVGNTDKCLLTTSQQPFALTNINENLIHYRKNCVGFTFGEGDGVIGRVFNTQLPEFSQEIWYYSIKEHPQRDFALSCGITAIWALPIFEPSQQSCVGVLEFLFFKFSAYCGGIFTALKLAGLVTIDTQMIGKQIQEGINHVAETEEFKGALEQVHQAHDVSLSLVWVRCKDSITYWSHDANSSSDCIVSGRGDFVVLNPDLPFDWNIGAYQFLKFLVGRVGQGLVGNAFLSDKPYLCTDLTQQSMSMALIARQLSFRGCFTICLQSTATRNHDYVLQFYLPMNTTGINFHQFFSSMVATLKHHLNHFEPVVVDPGDNLFGEVEIYSTNSDSDSLEFTTPNIITETEAGALRIEGEVLQASLNREEFANSRSDSNVDLQQRGKAFVLEKNCLEKKSINVLEETRFGKKSKTHNQKESSCSYETLKQHFGRKLEDVAMSLGVSRSTVKRWCRENEIERWPYPKRSKVTSSPPIPKPINVPIQSNIEPISDFTREDPSSSDAPTDLTTKQAMSTMTVKVTYMNDIIKFQLSFLSTMIDLVKKVTLRLKLIEGTFTIKYLDNNGGYILITCDEDLQDCINSFQISEETAIQMLIEPIAILEGKGPSTSDAPTNLALKRPVNTMTVKARYMNDIIKFQISFSSGMVDLLEKVTLRLKLCDGTFNIKYLDDVGEYILIRCDEDLQDCINGFRILKQTSMKMLIEPLTLDEK